MISLYSAGFSISTLYRSHVIDEIQMAKKRRSIVGDGAYLPISHVRSTTLATTEDMVVIILEEKLMTNA